MKHLINTSFCILLISMYSFSYGQMNNYNCKQELKEVTEQWHKVILPNELFGKTKQDLTDIRVFGITEDNDTIEAPYLLQLTKETLSNKEIAFNTLNTAHNEKGYYFTFEIPSQEPINQINLDFSRKNFDWRITLEGSHDQNEWFTIIENYRILSIKNDRTDFQFTKLSFPNSRYRFFRVLINSEKKPELKVASITKKQPADGTFRKYLVKKIITKENKQTKQTEIDVELQLPVRASHINIGVSDTFDYYRPVTIKYLTDSFKTEQGWKYNYSTLTTGVLNTIEKNEFKFNSTTVKKLKLFINNYDNQPLKIDTIQVKGYLHELVTRFTDQATYYLTYGNKKAIRPRYDIERFTDNIPKTVKIVELGDKLLIEKEEIQTTDPLFEDEKWLWSIMTLIILLLGWFSVKMIRKSE